MRKLVPFALVALVCMAPSQSRAQTMIEAGGEVGYTSSNVNDWLGRGVFAPDHLNYGANALVLFGRRGAGGLQIGGEFGYRRLLGYSYVDGGETLDATVDALRLLILTRFWFNDGAWFGEASAGVERIDGIRGFNAVKDPTLGLAAGTFFDLSDSFAIVAKARGTVIFDSGSPIATIGLITGGSYSLGR